MAINPETTAMVKAYLKHELIAKLDVEAMQKNVSRSCLIGLILDAYFLDMETHEAEEVKANEQK